MSIKDKIDNGDILINISGVYDEMLKLQSSLDYISKMENFSEECLSDVNFDPRNHRSCSDLLELLSFRIQTSIDLMDKFIMHWSFKEINKSEIVQYAICVV